jgi:hypothetical protein
VPKTHCSDSGISPVRRQKKPRTGAQDNVLPRRSPLAFGFATLGGRKSDEIDL